jgi:GNAT superfamily N-acetyltransferase
MADDTIRIEPATEHDVPVVLSLIRALADYEKLSDAVVATEDDLRRSLFGAGSHAHVEIAYVGDVAAGFAVWFHNYSTFLGKAGVYLEDLFVRPEYRRRGIGRRLLAHLARLAVDRDCGRMEWSVLGWNETAIRLYRSVGARPMHEWTVFRLTDDELARLADEKVD